MKNKFDFDKFRIVISCILFFIALFFYRDDIVFKIIIFICYIFSSYKLYIESSKSIRKGHVFDENFLMIIASLGALYIGEYEESVLILILYQIGESLSDRAILKSKKSIESLLDLRGDFVNVIVDGKIKQESVKKVKLGDVFEVKPGEVVPLDGVVVSGNSNIDMSSLTGESMPVVVSKNSKILSGSVNLDGIINVKVTALYKDSMATKIIEIMEQANEKKTKTEKFITRFSKIYTPIVILLAVLIVVIPTIIGLNFNEWLYRGLEFLVISCPCALVISVPLGFFCGIGRSSREGILVKGSNELSNLSKVEAIVFDKTGTLTEGDFEVISVHPSGDIAEDNLLKIASYASINSNHPISKALLKKSDLAIDKTKISGFKETSGKGVECSYGRSKILVGNYNFMISNNIKLDKKLKELSATYVARSGKYLGYIIVGDELRKEAKSIKDSLKELGVRKLFILSGDSKDAVEKVNKKLKFDECYYGMLPTDKVERIEEIKKDYYTLAVGDGLNDAPVVKTADVGMSMGVLGSDITIGASEVVLMNDDLNNISKAIKISKLTNNIIKFNIVFVLAFKLLIMLLAFIGYTPIWLAVIADVGVTLLTIFNDLRIIKKDLH